MNTTARLFLGSIIALVFALLLPYLAQATPIGGDPPCGQCPNCCKVPPDTGNGIAATSPPGNLSTGAPIATVASTSGSGLDLALDDNTYNADGSRALLDIGLGYGWTHSYSSLMFSQFGHMFRYDGGGRVARYQFLGNNTYQVARAISRL